MSLPVQRPIRKSLRNLKGFTQWPGKNIIYRAAEGATASWPQTYSSLLLQSWNSCFLLLSCSPATPRWVWTPQDNMPSVHSLPASVRGCVGNCSLLQGTGSSESRKCPSFQGCRGGNKDRKRKGGGGIYIWLVASVKGKERTGKRSSIWWWTSGIRYSIGRLNFLLIFFLVFYHFKENLSSLWLFVSTVII